MPASDAASGLKNAALYLAQPLPVLIFSPAARNIIELNPAMQQLCGYSVEELPDIGAFINHIISAPQEREHCLAMLTAQLAEAGRAAEAGLEESPQPGVARRAVTCMSRSKKIFRAELYVWTPPGLGAFPEVRIMQLFELSPVEVGVESGDLSVQNQAMRARIHTLEAELE